MIRLSLILCTAFSFCLPTNLQAQSSDDITTVILVRHAEREEDIDTLNAVGMERALELSRVLMDSGVDAIYASSFYRAQQTAQPLADALGLELNIYDPKKLNELGYQIVNNHMGETVLVTGHSNATPMTVNELGVSPSVANLDHHVYDHMFIVSLSKRRQPKLVTLKYGAPSH